MTNNNGSNGGGSKFMTGLMWGAIIGGGLVFLLGTKKGKKIIKTLSEEGIELSQLLGDDEGDDEEVEEVIVRSAPKINKQEEEASTVQPEEKSNGVNNKSTISKIASHRFFKRSPKR